MEALTSAEGGSAPARFFVLMGVCGVGKTTVAEAVADALGAPFIEADDFHSPANMRAMSAGVGLTDEQRWPWLQAVCERALVAGAHGGVVIACSALKKRYRDYIRGRLSDTVFIHLHGESRLIRARLDARRLHFMPAGMLDGQLADLEEPAGEPDTHTVEISRPPQLVADETVSICRQYVAAADRSPPARRAGRRRPEYQS